MSNQYGRRKPAGNPPEKRGFRVLLVALAGIFAGLLIAVGVALYVVNAPLPFQTSKPVDDQLVDHSQDQQLPLMVDGGGGVPVMPPVSLSDSLMEDAAENDPVAADDGVAVTDGATPPSTSTDLSTPITPKPIEETEKELPKTPAKNQFDFYNVLPGSDTAKATPTPPPAAPKPKGDKFYLQAGAFRSAQDADNLKASLALMGVEARIQTVIGSDNRSLHRVRVGPYRSQQEVEAAQKVLQESRISADIVKVSPTSSGQ